MSGVTSIFPRQCESQSASWDLPPLILGNPISRSFSSGRPGCRCRNENVPCGSYTDLSPCSYSSVLGMDWYMSRSHPGDCFSASCLFCVFSTAFMILGCDMYMVRDTSKKEKKDFGWRESAHYTLYSFIGWWIECIGIGFHLIWFWLGWLTLYFDWNETPGLGMLPSIFSL